MYLRFLVRMTVTAMELVIWANVTVILILLAKRAPINSAQCCAMVAAATLEVDAYANQVGRALSVNYETKSASQQIVQDMESALMVPANVSKDTKVLLAIRWTVLIPTVRVTGSVYLANVSAKKAGKASTALNRMRKLFAVYPIVQDMADSMSSYSVVSARRLGVDLTVQQSNVHWTVVKGADAAGVDANA